MTETLLVVSHCCQSCLVVRDEGSKNPSSQKSNSKTTTTTGSFLHVSLLLLECCDSGIMSHEHKTTGSSPPPPQSGTGGARQLTPEEEEAQQKLQELIDTTAPKGLGEGVRSGVSNIVGGAIGGAGIAVLAPTLGLAVGLKQGGLVGGIFGLVGGAVVGAVGAAGMIIGGALTGVVQIVRGVAAAPEAALAPRQGKWWNENEGKWVLTNMDDEVKALKSVPEDDSDLLGDIEKELEASAELGTGGAKPVKDMFYYDALEVTSNADDSAIRRRYYLLAKKYHPDRNKGDATAAEKFKDIAEAYQVLSDPELRKRYDRDGRDGLSPDKTSAADGGVAKIDPTVLFAFLFGSDKFHDYVGRLATATSAQIGDSPKISVKDARKLQRRRVVRLANKLIAKVAPWVAAKKDGHEVTAVEAEWKKEADELCTASYGHQLVTTIGKVRPWNAHPALVQGLLLVSFFH